MDMQSTNTMEQNISAGATGRIFTKFSSSPLYELQVASQPRTYTLLVWSGDVKDVSKLQSIHKASVRRFQQNL